MTGAFVTADQAPPDSVGVCGKEKPTALVGQLTRELVPANCIWSCGTIGVWEPWRRNHADLRRNAFSRSLLSK